MSIDRVSNLRQDPDFGTLIATYRVRLDSGGGLPKNKRQKWTPDTRDDDLDRWALQFAERQRAAEREKRSSPAAAAAPPSSEEPNRTLRRRSTKHPWNKICGEIARLCIDPKTRCVRVPKNETKLADAVLLFCQNTLNCDPPASDMREAVAAICEALRKI